ncbi:DUF2510 domain-containing protein [Actinoplanes aureus]|jgi:hypothetical protein|uniref:DUF2510 domain-containing protein n=1 Tax=Actinoplanes aureus TaxID=2792083 RepID=A0A931C8R7_9ACTN|nr:DUF2510 domain-containing protein [Actinoplanes aureus]MBG0560425.1 DUF2510 domain-containing protein [Actinoplanes aureus]
MSDTTATAVPAGWYADPAGAPQQRWWDGFRWTDHVQPAPFVMSLRPPAVTSRRFRWGLGEAGADLAEGRNSPALHALIVGIAGLVLSSLLLPSAIALIWGVIGLRRAEGWARSGRPPTGRVQAVGGIVLGAAGLLFGILLSFISP